MIHPTARLPYIAAYGFRRQQDIETVVKRLPKTKRHIFAVGAAVTPASLADGSADGSFATAAEVKAIVSGARTDSRLLYPVKFVARKPSANEPDLGMQLIDVRRTAGQSIQAMQISGTVATPKELTSFTHLASTTSPNLRFILEIPPAVLLAGGTVDKAIGTHVHYRAISDVMLAFQGELDLDQARALLTALRANFGHKLGYGISSTIAWDIADIAPLLAEFPDLSLEMEAPRPGVQLDPDDVLDFFEATSVLVG